MAEMAPTHVPPNWQLRPALASCLVSKRLRTGPARTRGSRNCCLGLAQDPGDEAGVHATFALDVGVPLEASCPQRDPAFPCCAVSWEGCLSARPCCVHRQDPFLALRDGEERSVQDCAVCCYCAGFSTRLLPRLQQHFPELSLRFCVQRTAVFKPVRPWKCQARSNVPLGELPDGLSACVGGGWGDRRGCCRMSAAPRQVGSAQPAVALPLSPLGPPTLLRTAALGAAECPPHPEKAPTDFSVSLGQRVPWEYV